MQHFFFFLSIIKISLLLLFECKRTRIAVVRSYANRISDLPVLGYTSCTLYRYLKVVVAARPIRRCRFPTRAEHDATTPPPPRRRRTRGDRTCTDHAFAAVLHAPVADRVRFKTVAALVRGCDKTQTRTPVHARDVHNTPSAHVRVNRFSIHRGYQR